MKSFTHGFVDVICGTALKVTAKLSIVWKLASCESKLVQRRIIGMGGWPINSESLVEISNSPVKLLKF